MLLCDSGQLPWRPPAEFLRADLDGVMAEISALEPFVEQDNVYCPAIAGRGFTLLFGYPDGTTSAVSGDAGGCNVVETGFRHYAGADDLLATVIDRFEQARRGERPPRPMPAPALDCNQGSLAGYALSLTGRLRDATRGLSCWRRSDVSEVGSFHVRDIAKRALRVLVRDARAHQVRKQTYPPGACTNFPRPFQQDLLLATTWGDVLVLRGICDDFLVEQAPDGGGKSTFWHPSPHAQRILDRLRR